MLRINKRIVVYVILILAIIIAALIYAYSRTFQYITVDYSNPIQKVTIEPKPSDDSDDEDATPPEPITLTSGEKTRLKKGDYILKSVGSIVDENPTNVTLGDTPVTKKLDYKYSDDYLAELYTKQASVISKALLKSNPKIKKYYQLTDPHLYDKGEWFGGILEYTGTESLERDYLRVVMEKSDDSWKVVAGPKLLLNKYDNSAVPVSILREVNALDIGQPVLQNGTTPIQTVD